VPRRPMIANPSSARSLLRLSRSNKLVLLEALVILTIASAIIKLLPFRRTVELTQRRLPRKIDDPEKQRRLIAQARWAVLACAGRVPWRAVCFQKGLTLQLMLRRRGIPSTLHYGVAQSEGEGLRAHVWVGVGDRTILGGEEAPQFSCLASFPAAARN
jgi:hypothetical protein